MCAKNRKIGFDLTSKNEGNNFNKDTDADKTGTDINSDKTKSTSEKNKFDKPKRETDPDTTGIDIDSDKTKPNNKVK
jgi:hypothetical protein